MSLPAALTAAVTACRGITGITTAVQGLPVPDVPSTSCPLFYVHWDGTWQERPLTFGGSSRNLERTYRLLLTLYLGSPEMRPAAALSAAAVYVDRVRRALGASDTLSGAVGNAQLGEAAHNLDTYYGADPAEAPVCQWTLTCTEWIANDAASQT